jgi:aminoglycoside phosphotransferase (APT) family kinase protein
MRGPNGEARSFEAMRGDIDRWMTAKYADRSEVRIGIFNPVSTGGLANETFLFDASWKSGGSIQTANYVLRLPPSGDALFATYDLKMQCQVQEILANNDIPAARPVALEPDRQWMGSPFLLMLRLSGRPSPDYPSYSLSGWIKDLPSKDQLKIADNFLYWLAQIHKLDVHRTGLYAAAKREDSSSPLASEFQWWKNYFKWVGGRVESSDITLVSDAFRWCEEHWPQDEPQASFLWGDARHGNALFNDSLEVTGVLDFENASIGPAEIDLGWWMAYRYNQAEMVGKEFPELPGFPDRSQSIEIFETHLGRKLRDFRWHEMFGAARQGACVCGLNRLIGNGVLPPVKLPSAIATWAMNIISS